MYVTKVRGSHFREGYHDYEIVTGGVMVHPRLVAGEHHGDFQPEVCKSGIANLDNMLGGGLTAGSTTLLLGPAGAGKSTASMQFVVNALAAGKKAAVYIFDEVMHTLLERSEKLCLTKPGGISAYVKEGSLHIQQIDPAEMAPGAFSHEVRRSVEAGAKVIVIDSLNGYLNAMPEERYLTTHLHEMFAYLNQKGILTIIVVAQHGMLTSSALPGDIDVSYLADTVLLFRYFEADGQVNQALSVFKKRTGPHERTIRQLTIDTSGFAIGEPLTHFRGIMTGVPQYDGASKSISTSGGPFRPPRTER
jgi:circadian clock protein KaiC